MLNNLQISCLLRPLAVTNRCWSSSRLMIPEHKVRAAKRCIAAAIYQIILAHAGYSLYITLYTRMGQKMPAEIDPSPGGI